MNFRRKTGRMVRLLALLMTISIFFVSQAMAADAPTAAYYQLVEVKTAVAKGTAKVNVREKPDSDSDREGRLSPGESCVITGESGNWWQVEFEGKTAYVNKDYVEVQTDTQEIAVVFEDALEASLEGLTAPGILQYRNEYRLKGKIKSNVPLTGVSAEIYNLRTLSVDRMASDTMKRDDKVYEYDLSEIAGDLSFRKLDPGEKKLIIRANSTNDSVVVAEIWFYVYTGDDEEYADPLSMTADCEIKSTTGKVKYLTDSKCDTGIELKGEEDNVTITLPADRIPEGLTLEWEKAPDNVVIKQFAEDGAELEIITETNDAGMIHFYYEMMGNARKIVVSTTDTESTLCEARVYELNQVSEVVQKWEKMPDTLDMLVISAHQDDEMLFFGGTIPYYAAQGKKVGVVYMADCSRERYDEALAGLWSCGLQYHPIFVGYKDKLVDDYDDAVELWGMETTENMLVDLIRRYQPEVIVTHDVKGEYGHNQHKVTCAAVQSAVTKAGDAAVSPDSAQEYGTYTPKKLYIHLYDQNKLTMTVYDEPSEVMHGLSATQIATIGYSKHVSQQDYFSMENHGVKYDNRKYGLAFTTVGEDVEKNNFFENID